MSILGAIADLFRKPRAAKVARGGSQQPPSDASFATSLVRSATDATKAIKHLMSWFAAPSGLQRALTPADQEEMARTQHMCAEFVEVARDAAAHMSASYKGTAGDIVYMANATSAGLRRILAGTPAYGQSSDEFDAMHAAEATALQAQADQALAHARALAQKVSRDSRPEQMAVRQHMPPAVVKAARKLAIQGLVADLGPERAYEMLGEEMWDGWS